MKKSVIKIILISSLLLVSCNSKKEKIYSSDEYDIYTQDNYIYIQIHDNGAFDIPIIILDDNNKPITLNEYYTITHKEED